MGVAAVKIKWPFDSKASAGAGMIGAGFPDVSASSLAGAQASNTQALDARMNDAVLETEFWIITPLSAVPFRNESSARRTIRRAAPRRRAPRVNRRSACARPLRSGPL